MNFSQASYCIFLFTLLLALFLSGNILLGLHKQAHLRYSAGERQEWKQAFDVSAPIAEQSHLIGNQVWDFNYTPLMVRLERFKTDDSGQLILNAAALEVLKSASKKLPTDINKQEVDRVLFVLKKSFPDGLGVQMGDLLLAYQSYASETLSLVKEVNNASESERLEQLKSINAKTSQLQNELFGTELGQALFADENRTHFYLNNRRVISLDVSLSRSEKKQKLQALQDEYSRSIKQP